jgi:hypothetical protein
MEILCRYYVDIMMEAHTHFRSVIIFHWANNNWRGKGLSYALYKECKIFPTDGALDAIRKIHVNTF